ncbi:MAG: hypothetical protein GF311_08320 [Candidatus Lokiarchaeota archaeon]|nr:hypothetical protein [Candidatus Lokiarchaeota archaeon]
MVRGISRKFLGNDTIRVSWRDAEALLSEKLEININKKWVPILESLENNSSLIFSKRWSKSSVPLKMYKMDNFSAVFSTEKNHNIILKIRLIDPETIHFMYTIKPAKNNMEFSSIQAIYQILLDGRADFIWVPHLRPEKGYVISDHVFRSPVIIYQKSDIAFALYPDLDIFTRDRSFPTFLNLDVKKSHKHLAHISYGFGISKPVEHVFFEHKRRYKIKLKKASTVAFGYYFKIYYNKSLQKIIQETNKWFWNNHGTICLNNSLIPQIIPYKINVDEGFKAIFERHKYWGDFFINSMECGGIWQRTWMGESKRPIEYITPDDLKKHTKKRMKEIAGTTSFLGKIINTLSNSPRWIKHFDRFTRHHPIVRRVAEVWNNAWFLNIRTAYGLMFFGHYWHNDELTKKANKILNTLLQLPRKKGLFPSIILPAKDKAHEFSYINGVKAFMFTDEYNIVDCCLAMYWALKLNRDFENNKLIIKKSVQLAELIEEIQLKNGAIPTFIKLAKNSKMIVSEDLINSASSGAALMFMTELYKTTKKEEFLPIAEKIATFLENEIVSENKWHDFEPFYSCTRLPLNFYDFHTENHVMNTLCIYWCAEGFKELYIITKEYNYLEIGEYILSILSLFQQVWDMPHIRINTFGGFGVQNADAELNDARQALFVRTYMEYYLETGKGEYMERGIAALRASWALQLLTEYEGICLGNLEGIETANGIDRGCVCENYGHSGIDFRVPGYIMFDWGIGTAAMATAYTKKHFGDIFIDYKFNKVWGICGIEIENFMLNNNHIQISLRMINEKNTILIIAREIPDRTINIILNETQLNNISKSQLEQGYTLNIDEL